jgi:transcriptional regulator of acetoin/glycerol metabolism
VSVLHLPAVPDWVWSGFHETPGALETPSGVRPVVERWLRARDLGAPLEGPPSDEHLLRGDALRVHADRAEPFARVAEPVLHRAERLFSSLGYQLLLADVDGVVVGTFAGGDFSDEARRVRLIEGACWSEAVRGTNAIGTALAEATPIAVKGSAHYGRRFHQLVCYAAPVHAPDGTVLGVLDATSALARADDAVALAVAAAAESVEAALRIGAYARVGATLLRTLGRSLERSTAAVLLVEAPGKIARLNAVAREMLGADAPSTIDDALGLSWAQLRAEALAPTPGGLLRDLGPRRASHLVWVDPVEAADDGLIAAIVHLEPVALRPSRALDGGARPASERHAPAVGAAPRPSRPAPRAGSSARPEPSAPFGRIFAEDEALRRAVTWAGRLAASEVPVMLLAETGSGKELFAEAIHAASPRWDAPFVAVNCGSIAPSLLESELFGYAAGAFTGADRAGRGGFFQAAHGGTLFLDEVAEMPPPMQVALLRALEDGGVRRVGAAQAEHVDVRVVCATCRDLPAMIERGEFRKDLYFRLRGATVSLPPLRARTDVVGLARHVLARLAERRGLERAPALTAEAERWLVAQAWPGNVRELKSLLDVALVLAGDGGWVSVEHLAPELGAPLGSPPSLGSRPSASGPSAPAVVRRPSDPPVIGAEPRLDGRLADVEARALRDVLEAARGNVSAAALRLGVARSTVYRLMRKHGLLVGD